MVVYEVIGVVVILALIALGLKTYLAETTPKGDGK